MVMKLVASAFVVAISAFAAAPKQAPADASKYRWADACRPCHEPIYQAWTKTKHATSLERLSDDQRKQACVGCHVTGPPSTVVDAGKIVNEGVQCEACHGPAAAHVADPANTAGLVKTPRADTCEACHSARGPHFKGFFYDAMKGLVHPGA